MTHICPLCGNCTAPDPVSIGRKGYRAKSWGGSPAPWLGGLTLAEVDALQAAGLARRDSAGWLVPTEIGKLALA